jgi:hypothetical protein
MCAVEETVMSKTLRAAFVLATLALVAPPLSAQQKGPDAETYELPKGWVIKPTPGLLGEPSILAKLAMSTDTGLGGEPSDGLYVETGNMVSGEGWISAGPGYRRTVLDGHGRLDMSAAVSWNYYTIAQVAFELPHLAHDRLSVGVHYRGWHQELFHQIAPLDLAFVADLLGQLTDRQWADAFRAGGYTPRDANRFIAALHRRIDEARRASAQPTLVTSSSSR